MLKGSEKLKIVSLIRTNGFEARLRRGKKKKGRDTFFICPIGRISVNFISWTSMATCREIPTLIKIGQKKWGTLHEELNKRFCCRRY